MKRYLTVLLGLFLGLMVLLGRNPMPPLTSSGSASAAQERPPDQGDLNHDSDKNGRGIEGPRKFDFKGEKK